MLTRAPVCCFFFFFFSLISQGLSAALREAEEDGVSWTFLRLLAVVLGLASLPAHAPLTPSSCPQIESEPSTPVPAGSSAAESEYDNVDFLDGVSDSLASLILGGDAPKLNLTGSEVRARAPPGALFGGLPTAATIGQARDSDHPTPPHPPRAGRRAQPGL